MKMLKIFTTEDTEEHRVNRLSSTLCNPVSSVVKSFYLASAKTAAPMFSTMQSANWLVFTLVAPSINRSKS
jgi:hypothetical protein